jgi:hypothetical protein
VEPHPKLAGNFQARERIGVGSFDLMGRRIPEPAKVMKQVRNLSRQDALKGKTAEGVLEALTFADVEGVVGDNEL